MKQGIGINWAESKRSDMAGLKKGLITQWMPPLLLGRGCGPQTFVGMQKNQRSFDERLRAK